jgi:N-methylhydantoinase A
VIGAEIARITSTLAEMEKKGRAMLADEAAGGDEIRIERLLDVGFAHRLQTYPILLGDGPIDQAAASDAERRFRKHQLDVFGVESADQCRIMGVRLRAAAITSLPPSPPALAAESDVADAIKKHRPAWFDEAGNFVDTPVYDRARLGPGHRLTGPAIIEEPDATTICPPGTSVVVDHLLNLVITPSQQNAHAARQKEAARA